MPRPPKIDEPTKTYSLLLKISQYEKLATIATFLQQSSIEQVAVADLMREAIEIYIQSFEEEMDDD